MRDRARRSHGYTRHLIDRSVLVRNGGVAGPLRDDRRYINTRSWHGGDRALDADRKLLSSQRQVRRAEASQ